MLWCSRTRIVLKQYLSRRWSGWPVGCDSLWHRKACPPWAHSGLPSVACSRTHSSRNTAGGRPQCLRASPARPERWPLRSPYTAPKTTWQEKREVINWYALLKATVYTCGTSAQMVHWLLIRWMCSVHFPHSPFKCLFWQVYVLWACTKACANGGLLYGSNKCTNTAKATLRQASKIIKKSLVLLTEADQGTHFLNRCKWRRDFTIQNNLILRDWIDCLYRILDWYIFCTWIFF